MLKRSLQEILKSRVYLLTVAVTLGCMILDYWEEFAGYGLLDDLELNAVYYGERITSGGTINLYLSLLAAVPISFFLQEELNSGYFQMVVTRKTKCRYIVAKLAAAFLGVVLQFLVAQAIWFLLLSIHYHVLPNFEYPSETYGITEWGRLCRSRGWHGLVEYTGNLSIFIYQLLPWTAFAMAFSAWSRNRYVGLAAPFLVEKIVIVFNFTLFNGVADGWWSGFNSSTFQYSQIWKLSYNTFLLFVAVGLFVWGILRKFRKGK